MEIMAKSTLFNAQNDGNYIFELWISIFLGRTMPPDPLLSEHMIYYATIYLLYLLQCSWKTWTLFKALTYASLEKYTEDSR